MIGMIGAFAFCRFIRFKRFCRLWCKHSQRPKRKVGMTVGATVIAIAIMSPFMGMLSDAVGRKISLWHPLPLWQYPRWWLGCLTHSPVSSFGDLCTGLAVPGITVVTIAYVGEEYAGKEMAKKWCPTMSQVPYLGIFRTLYLGAFEELIGWEKGFVFMGVLTVLGAGLAVLVITALTAFSCQSKFYIGAAHAE